MGSTRVALGLVAGALVVTGVFVPVGSAQAEAETYSSWTHRQDARSPQSDTTTTHADTAFRLYSFNDQVTITADATDTAPDAGIEFLPPAGDTLQSGRTYKVGGAFRAPTATRGQVISFSGGTMCGRTWDELDAWSSHPVAPTNGWFHVNHVEYVDGEVVSFAATYEISCQYLDAPLGFEGSVAVNAPSPAAAPPAAPVAPGPVVGLAAENTTPKLPDTTVTALTWTTPDPAGDVTIDVVQSPHESLFSSSVGDPDTRLWRGTTTSWSDPYVDFMDVRTYRVTPRGPTGRLGTPSYVTIRASRLDTPVTTRGIQIGEKVSFTGRLSEALGVDEQNGDPMSGPAIVGRRLLMCQQPTEGSVPTDCNEVDSAVTTSDGRFAVEAEPVANSYYTVRLPATRNRVGNSSFVLMTGVAPQTDLRAPASQRLAPRNRALPRSGATVSVPRGSLVRFTTSRARRGSLGVVRLQHRSAGTWHTIVRKSIGTGTTRLRLPVRMSYARGLHTFRVLKPGDSRHVNGYSRVITVRVR